MNVDVAEQSLQPGYRCTLQATFISVDLTNTDQRHTAMRSLAETQCYTASYGCNPHRRISIRNISPGEKIGGKTLFKEEMQISLSLLKDHEFGAQIPTFYLFTNSVCRT